MIRAHAFQKAMAQVHKQMGAQQPQRVTQMSKQEPELTEWFPGDVAPVRVGVYERDFFGYEKYSRWTGKTWMSFCTTQERATTQKRESDYQDLPWRGLVKESK